jgi:hypothetical protein
MLLKSKQRHIKRGIGTHVIVICGLEKALGILVVLKKN